MKRRELLSAAVLVAAAARAQDAGVSVSRGWPAEEKLSKAKREISEAMAKVRLDNADGPDPLPRAPRRSK